MPGGCGQFSRLHVAKQCYDNKVFTVPPKSNEGYQPFHLLCMSFLVVRPLEEEARLWSHLTGPRCNLNYSSDMKGISLKGTDVSRLHPCVKLKARCSDSPKLNCVCVRVCVYVSMPYVWTTAKYQVYQQQPKLTPLNFLLNIN